MLRSTQWKWENKNPEQDIIDNFNDSFGINNSLKNS